MEKTEREILIRSQDGLVYYKFGFPIYVDRVNYSYRDIGRSYALRMGNDEAIGFYKEQKHAIHAMNFLLAKRNYYLYDAPSTIKSVILNVPTDEAVRETPDEDLLNGIPVKENSKENDNL